MSDINYHLNYFYNNTHFELKEKSVDTCSINAESYVSNDEDAYSDVEKNVFVKHSYCIGLRSEGNLMIDRTEEYSKTIDHIILMTEFTTIL